MQHYDVIVIGAGPAGLTVANLLASRGLKVAVIERFKKRYGLPRAGHIDHEALRILQELGALAPVLEDAVPWQDNRWLNAAGEVLFDFPHWTNTTSGFASAGLFQPVLEDALFATMERLDAWIDFYPGVELIDLEQNKDGVEVLVQDDSGKRRYRASYLLAADGASSFVRERLGVPRDDFGFNEHWFVVDCAYKRPCDYGPPAIVGDPERPHYFGPLGKRHHRFEWMVLPKDWDLDLKSPEAAWQLLARDGVSPDDVEIIRQAAFNFEYRLATRWREGRVFLVGDAAHTTPPCMGQGMCSGMRDGVNIAWKLALVSEGRADESILNSYFSERLPHVRIWSDIALNAGRIAFTTDPAEAAERDERIRRGEGPQWGETPTLGDGLFDDPQVAGVDMQHEMFPQRRARCEGREGRFDDLTTYNFLLVSVGAGRAELTQEAQMAISRLRIQWLEIGAAGDLVDLEGDYATFFKNKAVVAIVIRPDRFIFGAAPTVGDVAGLLERLGRSIPAPYASH